MTDEFADVAPSKTDTGWQEGDIPQEEVSQNYEDYDYDDIEEDEDADS